MAKKDERAMQSLKEIKDWATELRLKMRVMTEREYQKLVSKIEKSAKVYLESE